MFHVTAFRFVGWFCLLFFRPLVLCLQNVHIIRKLLQRFGAPALMFEMDLSSVDKDAVNLGEVFLLSKGYKNASASKKFLIMSH